MNTELFGRATDYTRVVLSELTSDDLRRPTPCEGWDAERVVLHLADVIGALTGVVDTGTPGLPQPLRANEPDLVALLDERLAKLAHAFVTATDATRVENAALAGAVELTTHGWDIGLARDCGHRIPESLAADVLALVSPALDVSARGQNFAAPVDIPSNSLASDRLVAFLGRVPRR